MKIQFEIPGAIRAKGRPRFARMGSFVKTYTSKEDISYENWVKQCFIVENSTYEMPPSDMPLKATIIVFMVIPKSTSKKKRELMEMDYIRPTKKPDNDNIAKTILDSLNKIAFNDDSQIVDLHVSKHYRDKELVKVIIEELDEV